MEVAKEQTPKERRRSRRIPVELWVKEENGDYYYFHQASDLSIGGLFLNNKIISRDSTHATFKFKLPNSADIITVKGEAVYDVVKNKLQKKTGTGIKFIDLKPEHKKVIEDYIDGNRFAHL
jgi:hypothetical protein